ncbi:MAG: hypothetical protein ACFFCV_02570 [Promethearchaeota archaeon]
MTPERPLSKKKIAQQTISISPALKDKIEKYVYENNKRHPNDKRFKSISRFYNFVMERVMEIFEKGKTLDDFETFLDGYLRSFFDNLSFNAIIPYYENAIKTNRYESPTLEKNTFFFFTLRRLYTSHINPYDIKSINTFFSRVRNYIFSNKLTKEFRLDLFTGKGRHDLTGVFEQAGLYKNLSFETYKYTAAFFGLLGNKITDFLYSRKDDYCRFDLKATELFFKKDLAKRERIKLMNHNLSYFINYNRVIEDKDYYLWMKMAVDKQILITFASEEVKEKWVNLIESEIEKFGEKEDYPLNLLRFFEKLHWIEIKSEKDLSFQFRLSDSKYIDEREFLLETLSKKFQVSCEDEKYYLKKIMKL